jgi:hypothetical protein
MKHLADNIGFNDTGNEVVMKFKLDTVGAKNLL